MTAIKSPFPGSSEDGDSSRSDASSGHGVPPTFWKVLAQHRKSVVWSAFFSLGIIMLAFDPMLLSSLYAMPAFQEAFGEAYGTGYIIPASWQTALSLGNPIGLVVGALTAGIPLDALGRKKTFAAAAILSACCVFIQFFASDLRTLLAGEILAGLILGNFIVIAPTYASEVCPTQLRGHLTSYINFVYVLGQLLANAVTLATSNRDDRWAYSIPFAVQWVWPALILAGIGFAPESPWWLIRQGRLSDARESLITLSCEGAPIGQILNAMVETDRLEKEAKAVSTYRNLFQGTSRRRTEIGTGVFCSQLLSGIYLVGYATYFAEIGGLSSDNAFRMTLGTFGAGLAATVASWVMMLYVGRRSMWLTGTACVSILMVIIGLIDVSPAYSSSAAWAQSAMLMLFNIAYDATLGPLGYVLLVECSSTKLRAKSVAFATCVQQTIGVVMSVIIPHLIGPDAANIRGKIGFLFAFFSATCLLWAALRVPDTKDLSFDQINECFASGISARRFQEKVEKREHTSEA